MRKELEDAAREGASRRSNSPVPALVELERTGSLSDLTGNAKAAGFFSDGIPKRIHLKFVSFDHIQHCNMNHSYRFSSCNSNGYSFCMV